MDQAKNAVRVDLPTSGSKTLLARFRILRALGQFDADYAWGVCVAPTKPHVVQLARRLGRDFDPIKRLGHRGTQPVFAIRI